MLTTYSFKHDSNPGIQGVPLFTPKPPPRGLAYNPTDTHLSMKTYADHVGNRGAGTTKQQDWIPGDFGGGRYHPQSGQIVDAGMTRFTPQAHQEVEIEATENHRTIAVRQHDTAWQLAIIGIVCIAIIVLGKVTHTM